MSTIEMGRAGKAEFTLEPGANLALLYGFGSPAVLPEYHSEEEIQNPGIAVVALTKTLPEDVGTLSFWTAIKFGTMPKEISSQLVFIGNAKKEGDAVTITPSLEERTEEMRLSGLTYAVEHTVIAPEMLVLSDGRVFASSQLRDNKEQLNSLLVQHVK